MAAYRHLLSPLRPFPSISCGLPWQPSPCPPHYRTAFDASAAAALRSTCWQCRTPCRARGRGGPCFQSAMGASAPELPALRRMVEGSKLPRGLSGAPTIAPFGRGVSASAPRPDTDASDAGCSRQPRAQGSSGCNRLAPRSRPLSAGFPPWFVPRSNAGRSALMVWLKHGSVSNTSNREQAHEPFRVNGEAHHRMD